MLRLASATVLSFFALSLVASAQSPNPCPDERETEKAAPGRSKKYDQCAVFSWTFHGQVGAGGNIYVVDVSAGTGGAVTIETEKECAYEASDFSDQWSTCDGEAKDGAWCEDEAYDVIQKVWKTKEISPCPEVNIWEYIVQVLTTGKATLPGCDPLLPAPAITHKSAQQRGCDGDGQLDGSEFSGQYLLLEGDPRMSLGNSTGPAGGAQMQALLDMLAPDDLANQPTIIQDLADDFGVIPGESNLFVDSTFTQFDDLGQVEYSVDRTINGSFRSDGTYRFSCPQVAFEEGTGRPVGFLEEWVRDSQGIYRFTSGSNNGIAVPILGGAADEMQTLHFPEVDMIQDWVENPFPLSHSASFEYTVDSSDPNLSTVFGGVKADKYLNQSSLKVVAPTATTYPSSIEFLTSTGSPFQVQLYSDYAQVGSVHTRPLSVTRQLFNPISGALVATWELSFSARNIQATTGTPFVPPSSASGNWFSRN